MKRTRMTVKYDGYKIRVLGWGNTYSAWVMGLVNGKLTRVAIQSGGFTSKAKAVAAGKQHIDLISDENRRGCVMTGGAKFRREAAKAKRLMEAARLKFPCELCETQVLEKKLTMIPWRDGIKHVCQVCERNTRNRLERLID